MRLQNLIAASLGLSILPFASFANVSAAQAGRLGLDLTPIGAQAAASHDGMIPAYAGGLPRSGPLEGKYPSNPGIEADEPIFDITRTNMERFAGALSEGHKELLRRFPETYKIPVYPSHRPVSFPDHIIEYTKKNATTAVLEDTDRVLNARHGFPFPIPGSGAEVIWNHKTRWRSNGVIRHNNQIIMRADGSYQRTRIVESIKFLYANEYIKGSSEGPLLYYMSEVTEPARYAGLMYLVHDNSDQTTNYRQSWLYSPDLRRVRRAPNVGYDNPYEGSGGNQFNDQVDMFNGALDRYDWKLVGKKEMYIPYNSYAIAKPTVHYEDIMAAPHLNMDLTRFEKHRVWIVEANLKPGQHHVIGKRVFYVDEDSWAINTVDCYDQKGNLFRMQEAHQVFSDNSQAIGGTPEVYYNFESGEVFMTALSNEDAVNDFSPNFDDKFFRPRTLTARAMK